jgi:arsenate reductase
MKQKVLFICRHNSGRSQIAEAFLRKFSADRLDIESAGFDPAESVNPLVIEVMNEEGIDLSDKKPQSVFELFKSGNVYAYVITVCDDSEDRCPVFPGITKRWSVPFPDPSKVSGSREEKLSKVREIRDQIKTWLLNSVKGEIL